MAERVCPAKQLDAFKLAAAVTADGGSPASSRSRRPGTPTSNWDIDKVAETLLEVIDDE